MGDDRLRVAAAVGVDVLDRLTHRVDDADCELQRQVLAVPILLGGRRHRDVRRRPPRALVAVEHDPRLAERAERAGEERIGDAGVDEQRLGRVADAGALQLRVQRDRLRGCEIGLASTYTWQLPDAA